MPEPDRTPTGFIVRIVQRFLTSKLSILFIFFSLSMGAAAIFVTPREEEPQIVVPLADVYVQAPGASAEEVEKGDLPCWNPVLVRMSPEKIILFYKIGGHPQNWVGYMKVSEDEGEKWSKPHSLQKYGIIGPTKNKPIFCKNYMICGSSRETKDEWTAHAELLRLNDSKEENRRL